MHNWQIVVFVVTITAISMAGAGLVKLMRPWQAWALYATIIGGMICTGLILITFLAKLMHH